MYFRCTTCKNEKLCKYSDYIKQMSENIEKADVPDDFKKCLEIGCSNYQWGLPVVNMCTSDPVWPPIWSPYYNYCQSNAALPLADRCCSDQKKKKR